MSKDLDNNFLVSLQKIKDPNNLHMNIFTKAISNKPSLFTTSNLRKIGRACENALESLNQLEGSKREEFLRDYSQKIGVLKQRVVSREEEKIKHIQSNPILRFFGLGKFISNIYSRWMSPRIVVPDREVTSLFIKQIKKNNF